MDKIKASFAPLADSNIEILILGSLPGEKSLEMAEYYAHPQNRFWRLMSALTQKQFPTNYSEKKSLLLSNKIGVWDVVQQAKRVGSLDVNIIDEIPNDLDAFISEHKNLRIVAFNGSKSQKLYDKYFIRREHLNYFALPSTSPANANYNFAKLLEKWKEIFAVKD